MSQKKRIKLWQAGVIAALLSILASIDLAFLRSDFLPTLAVNLVLFDIVFFAAVVCAVNRFVRGSLRETAIVCIGLVSLYIGPVVFVFVSCTLFAFR